MTRDKSSRLGKGLGSIFGEDITAAIEDIQSGKIDTGNRTMEIPVNDIRPNPYQPRKVFDEKALQELAQSIKEHGVFTPILVRKSVQGYELIAGERRFRASKLAQKTTIPAIVMDFSEEQMMEISLLENIQRENLNAIEEANAYAKLVDRFSYTQEVLASRVGKSRTHVANMMRLLKLPHEVQELVINKQLSMGHVRPLITIEDESEIIDLAKQIVEEDLSVRAVEKLIQNKGKEKIEKEPTEKDPNLVYVENLLELKLQTRITVDKKNITISYIGTDDLNRILEILGCIEE